MNITPTGELFHAPMAMTEVSPLAHTKERYLWAVLDQTALEDAMESAKGRTPGRRGRGHGSSLQQLPGGHRARMMGAHKNPVP